MRAPARREQLLDVTTALAVEDGFHAITIEAVAARAGVTRALVYQHFASLDHLLEAVIEREMTRARAQVSETALTNLDEGDPRQLMLESLESFLRAVHDHPRTWRLVLLPPEGAPATLRNSIARGRHSVLTQLARAVRAGLRDGDDSDAELTAQLLSAISDEYARLELTDPTRFTPERLLRHARWWLNQASFGLSGHPTRRES